METPVLIDRNCEDPAHDQVLLNLAMESPPSFSRFQRLVEIVGIEEMDMQSGRARYRFYKNRGYEVGHIDLLLATR